MDRHDSPGITPKDAAKGHLLDTEIQDKFNCRFLTYWLDVNRGHGFCLVEAPNKEAVEEVHRNSHGQVPNKIIEVDEKLIELFLGRISDPETSGTDEIESFINETAFRTIMIIEFIYPSLINPKSSYNKSSESLDYFNKTVNESLEHYEGRRIGNIYEGFMASFFLVPNSINCAKKIREDVKFFNTRADGNSINISISLAIGSPVAENDKFFGDTIQLAKRLNMIAKEGQIIISSAIRDTNKRLVFSETDSIKLLSPSEEKFLNQLMDSTEKLWNDEQFNLDNFSRQIGISKAQLYRKVISLTGYSPNVFIREYRLRKAVKLIEKMNGNISEIAFESGFGNPSYFSKCFQKRFGILPSVYANAFS